MTVMTSITDHFRELHNLLNRFEGSKEKTDILVRLRNMEQQLAAMGVDMRQVTNPDGSKATPGQPPVTYSYPSDPAGQSSGIGGLAPGSSSEKQQNLQSGEATVTTPVDSARPPQVWHWVS